VMGRQRDVETPVRAPAPDERDVEHGLSL
jgi:hypothetical protein